MNFDDLDAFKQSYVDEAGELFFPDFQNGLDIVNKNFANMYEF